MHLRNRPNKLLHHLRNCQVAWVRPGTEKGEPEASLMLRPSEVGLGCAYCSFKEKPGFQSFGCVLWKHCNQFPYRCSVVIVPLATRATPTSVTSWLAVKQADAQWASTGFTCLFHLLVLAPKFSFGEPFLHPLLDGPHLTQQLLLSPHQGSVSLRFKDV